MASQQTVKINFLANATQAQTAILGIGRSLTTLQTSAGGANSTLGGMVTPMLKVAKAGAAVAAAYVAIASSARLAAAAVNVNREFELSMAKVKAVVQTAPGYTKEAFGAMEAEVRRLGATTVFSAGQAAEGLKRLAQSGFTAEQATNALQGTLFLAQTGELELADSARIVSDTLRAFKANASEATRYADVLAFTTSRASTDVTQLGEAFKYVGPISGGMGQNLEDVSAALGILSNSGVKASMAGTALRGMMIQLADTNSKAHRELLKMGLTAGDIMPSKMNSLVDIMGKLESVGVNANNAYALFGQRAGVAANILSSSTKELRDLSSATVAAEGTSKSMAGIMDDTYHGSVLRMKSAWEELLIVMGESGMMGGLRSMIDSTTGVIAMLTEAVHVLRNAMSAGQLGEVLLTSLKWAAMQGVNVLFTGLVAAFTLATDIIVGVFKSIVDPSFWEGMFLVFASIGGVLLGAVMELLAALIEAGDGFLTNMLGGVMLISDKLVGGLIYAAGVFGVKILEVTDKMLGRLFGLAEILGFDVGGPNLEDAKANAAATRDEGKALMGSSFADNKAQAKAMLETAVTGLRGGAQNRFDSAKDAASGIKDTLGKSLGNNFVAPMAKSILGLGDTKVFDMGKIESEMGNLFGKFGPRLITGPVPDSQLAGGDGEGAGEDEAESGGARRTAMAGSFRSAINSIMGRTAFEEVAQTAMKQKDIMVKVLKQSEETNKHLREINERGGRKSYSTFD